MGRRGPKPTPAYLKILRGNPGGHEIRSGQPPAVMALPAAPSKYWKTRGKDHWRVLGRKLIESGVLSNLDLLALELLVDAVLAYEATRGSGDQRAIDKTYRRMREMLREFGLTPASRSSVQHAEQPKKEEQPDPAMKYFA